MRNGIIVLDIILFALIPVSGQQPFYTIKTFNAPERVFPASGNMVIRPDSGNALKQVREAVRPEPDQLLLRRRFGPGDYALFLGRKNSGLSDILSVFIPPRGMEPYDLIGMKLYIRETDNPNADIANVYFDDCLVYVENAAKIYFYDLKWESIPMLSGSPATLSITSYPSGAHVFIDGKFKGTTPLNHGPIYESSIVVCVKREGYYVQDRFVHIAGAREAKEHFILPKMIPSSYGVYIDPDSYCMLDKKSACSLEKRIAELKAQIDVQRLILRKDFEQQMNEYPPLQPQGEFEKTEDYNIRKSAYDEKKGNVPGSPTPSGDPALSRLENELIKLQEYRKEAENRIFHRYFSSQGLSIGRYTPDSEYFPVNIKIREQGHAFSFSGKLAFPISRAPDFKHNIDQSRLKLSYKSRLIQEKGDKIKLLYEPSGLFVMFKGGEYELEGYCSFSDTASTAPYNNESRTISGNLAENERR